MSTQKRSDEDFARELASHLELETEQRIADGLAPDAARAAARRDFGNVTAARERFYEARRVLWLDHLVQDVRCAARNMRRAPVAALVAVASLAAGIGATTVTLTVRDAVFRKPPVLYHDPEQLSHVQIDSPDRAVRRGSAPPAALYRTWRDTLRVQHRRDHRAAGAPRSASWRPHRHGPVARRHAGLLRAHRRQGPPRGNGARRGTRRRQRPARDPQLRGVAATLRRARRRGRARHLDRQPAAHDHRRPARALLVLGHELADLDAARRAGAAARPGARGDRATDRGRDAGDARGPAADGPRRLRGTPARCRARPPRAGARRRRHADRPSGGDRPALHPCRLGPADAPHRVRERRDPDDRAVDGARARDRDSRLDWREPRPDRPLAAHRVRPGRHPRRHPRRVLHVRAARVDRRSAAAISSSSICRSTPACSSRRPSSRC